MAYGGSIPGWTGSGVNAVHAVNIGSGDWAVMLYYNNEITLDTGLDTNTAGGSYAMSFDYGTANYGTESQGTNSTDGLSVEILRASDDSVLAEGTFTPGVWGAGNYDLEAGLQGTLSYTGDGTGDVIIEVLNSNPTDRRLEGVSVT